MNPCDHERPKICVYDCPKNPDLDYKIAVMQAARDGLPVQLQYRGSLEGWSPMEGELPSWDWSNLRYRIDPASRPKKLVPWTHETFPREMIWLRANDSPEATCWRRAVSFTLTGIHMGEYLGQFSYKDLFEGGWVYSLDNGKSWSRCGVETESL